MLMNLCGFTYGMQGFIPAAVSTVGGSALAFVVLRSLFSNRLRKWTTTNEKWGALEAVIVSTLMCCTISYPLCRAACEGLTSYYSHPHLVVSSVGILQFSVRRK